MIIAIDGPAGAGKSTVAKLVAKRLRFHYIDTGAMYRCLTLMAIEQNINISDTDAMVKMASSVDIDLEYSASGELKVFLNGRDVSLLIRQPRISQFVSDVAKIKEIRMIMLEKQRVLGSKKDCLLDGRDIGTVVFPNADIKFYIDADFSERANRRYKELKSGAEQVTIKDVEKDLGNRDNIDSTRECAPLKRAEDAIYIDTTNMSIEEVVDKLLKYILAQNSKRKT